MNLTEKRDDGSLPAKPAFANAHRQRRRTVWLAVIAVAVVYLLNVSFCVRSAAFYMPYTFKASDMYANLLWADSIKQQGWLNPHPHHISARALSSRG